MIAILLVGFIAVIISLICIYRRLGSMIEVNKYGFGLIYDINERLELDDYQKQKNTDKLKT